jgi:hypothetical protein
VAKEEKEAALGKAVGVRVDEVEELGARRDGVNLVEKESWLDAVAEFV